MQVVHYIPSPNPQERNRPRDEVIDDETYEVIDDETYEVIDDETYDEMMMKLL